MKINKNPKLFPKLKIKIKNKIKKKDQIVKLSK